MIFIASICALLIVLEKRRRGSLQPFDANVRQFGFRVNGLPELFKLFVAGFAVTRYDRHDRTVPRRPAATVGTLRQHLFQFADLTIRGVNDHGERMIAAMRRAA